MARKSNSRIIGVCLLRENDQFYKSMKRGFLEGAKEYKDSILIVSAEGEMDRQRQQVRDLINKSVDAIIICPCDSVEIGPVIAEANKKKIPVITADISNTSQKGRVITHITSNNYEGGRLAGELLCKAIDNKGKVAIMNHFGVNSVAERIIGFKDSIKKHKNVKLVSIESADGHRELAGKLTGKLLKKAPDIRGIFGANDMMALGAMESVEAAGKLGKIMITGYDASHRLRMAIAKGKVYGAVRQHPFTIGYRAINVVHDYFKGKTIPGNIPVKVEAIGGEMGIKKAEWMKGATEKDILYQLGVLLSMPEDIDEILCMYLDLLCRSVGIGKASVCTFGKDTGDSGIIAYNGLDWRLRLELNNYKVVKYIFDELSAGKSAIHINTGTISRVNPRLARNMKSSGLDAMTVIPLNVRDTMVGALAVYHDNKKMDMKVIKLKVEAFVSFAGLAIENGQIKDRIKMSEDIAEIDSLTELYNRQFFYKFLDKEMSMAMRFKYPLSLAVMDLDNFKKYNDLYGHLSGDLILREFSNILKNNVRDYDLVARYGGDEIVMVMPHTPIKEAQALVDRLRRMIADTPVFNVVEKGSSTVKVTMSGGIATYPNNARTKSGLIDTADKALYRAKKEGRNRVYSSIIRLNDSLKFAFFPPARNKYYSGVIKGIREVSENAGHISLSVDIPAKSGIAGYRDLLSRAAKNNVNALGVYSNDVSHNLIMKAADTGMKVFVIKNDDAEIVNHKNVSYIEINQKKVGAKIAQVLVKLLRYKGKVAVIESPEEGAEYSRRKEGFLEVVNKNSGISLITRKTSPSRAGAAAVLKKLLEKNSDLDAVFTYNTEMAAGVSDTVKKLGLAGRFFIVSISDSPRINETIKKGGLTVMLNLNPVEIGRALMRTMLRCVYKGKSVREVETEIMKLIYFGEET